MRLIVTRPVEDAAPLIEALERLGHDAIKAPLLDIRLDPVADIPALPYQAVLITSANGARALARHHALERLKDALAVAVGPASAEAARRAGFSRVAVADGDVVTLVAWVRRHLDPAAGPLLHASGDVTTGQLQPSLEASGFTVRRTVLYEAQALESLPEGCIAVLRAGRADGVLLFSPRTARIWTGLLDHHGLLAVVRGLTHFCLSSNVAAAVSEALGAETVIRIAERPDEDSMLRLLG